MAMNRSWVHRALVAALFALSVLLGCTGGGVVGKYKGEIELPADQKNSPLAGMASGMAGSMSLELTADKTFAMSMMGFPAEGTYEVTGDTVVLTTTKAMGMATPAGASSAKPMRLTIEDGGKSLVLADEKQPEKGKLKFVRT